MDANFAVALKYVLEDEKGYVEDQGGPTNLGVTLSTLSQYLGRTASVAEVQALTPDTVTPIYKKMFWDKAACGDMPAGLDYFIFDAAVQHGPTRAVGLAQLGLGMLPDGVVGPHTRAVLATLAAPATVCAVLLRAILARATFYQTLQAWKSGLDTNGWTNRQLKVATRSAALCFGGLTA
jgi:lysozyme family protein